MKLYEKYLKYSKEYEGILLKLKFEKFGEYLQLMKLMK
jgi:hypothetical protein